MTISRRISDLDTAASVISTDLVPIAKDTGVGLTGFDTQHVSMSALGVSLPVSVDVDDSVERTLQSKLSEVVSVLDFGATGDGVTDDREAVRAAVAALTDAGGEVVFPRGRYRFDDAENSQIVVPSNITLRGEVGAVIFFDDKPTTTANPASTNRAFYLGDTENVVFDSLTFEGTAVTYPNITNSKQLLGGVRNFNIVVRGCTFRNLRHMAMGFGGTRGGRVIDCTFDTVARDGARFTHSQGVVIVGNRFKNVSDDSVALHSSDASYPTIEPPQGHIISGNVFEDSDGIRALGAKSITVSGNTFRRPRNQAVHIEQGWSANEGNTPQFAINITGNTITDALRPNPGGTTPIAIINVISAARDANGLSEQPGVTTDPFEYLYVVNTDAGGVVNPGMFSVTVANNVIARTLPNVAAFSDWGYGELFDHRNGGGTALWEDPAITDADFGFHGIYIKGPADGVLVSGNQISGLPNNYRAIRFDANGTTNLVDLGDVLVTNNIIRDCPGGGVFASFVGSATQARALIVQNNVFDLDPFFRHPDHAADNTWTDISTCRAVTIGIGGSLIMTGNTLKHLGQPNGQGAADAQYFGNFIWSDPVAAGNDAGNKGVRVVDETQICIVYDADPTSATFGQVSTTPAAAASTIPTSGTYIKGHVIRHTIPTVLGAASSQYIISGWIRLTTGSSHVLDTDWAEMRTLTGT